MLLRRCSAHQLNSLWCIWYAFIYMAIEAYLVHRAYWRAQRLDSEQPHFEYAIIYFLVALSVTATIFFVITCFMKVGNFANDSQKLGKLVARVVTSEKSRNKPGRCGKLWRHFLPIGPFLHLIAAFSLMFSALMVDGFLIRKGKKVQTDTWSSELDFLLNRKPSSFLYFTHQNTTRVDTPSSPIIQVEFINFLAALLICSVRYASVYWFTNKYFTTIFAIHQLIIFVESVFAWCGYTVLYKLGMSKIFFLANKVKISDVYLHMEVSLQPSAASALYLLSGLTVILMSVFVFEYGHRRYYQFYKAVSAKYKMALEGVGPWNGKSKSSCRNYAINFSAVGFLILFVLFRIPLLLEYISLYRMSKDKLVLIAFVIDAVLIFWWVMIWLFFTVKQSWDFKVQLPYMSKKTTPAHRPDSRGGSLRNLPNGLTGSLRSYSDNGLVGSASGSYRLARHVHQRPALSNMMVPFADVENASIHSQQGSIIDSGEEQRNLLEPLGGTVPSGRRSPQPPPPERSSTPPRQSGMKVRPPRRVTSNRVTFMDNITTIPESDHEHADHDDGANQDEPDTQIRILPARRSSDPDNEFENNLDLPNSKDINVSSRNKDLNMLDKCGDKPLIKADNRINQSQSFSFGEPTQPPQPPERPNSYDESNGHLTVVTDTPPTRPVLSTSPGGTAFALSQQPKRPLSFNQRVSASNPPSLPGFIAKAPPPYERYGHSYGMVTFGQPKSAKEKETERDSALPSSQDTSDGSSNGSTKTPTDETSTPTINGSTSALCSEV